MKSSTRTQTDERIEIPASELGPREAASGSTMVATWKHKRETYTFDGVQWVLTETVLL